MMRSSIVASLLTCLLWLGSTAQAETPVVKQAGSINACDFFDNIDFLSFLSGTDLIDAIDLNGDFEVRLGALIPSGNGVPDAANELGLLERILNDPTFDNGVLNHQQVKEAWDANLAQMKEGQLGGLLTDYLEAEAPGIIELFTAYVTLGDGFYTAETPARGTGTGSFGLVAALLTQFETLLRSLGVPSFLLLRDGTLDPTDFTLLTDLVALDTADADGDGLSNFDEFEIFGSERCEDKGGTVIAYAAAALSPDADDDGMSDNYEVRYAAEDGTLGLFPAVPDGDDNLDGDLLTNLEEYFRDSDPLDLDDPEITRFVGATGTNEPFPVGGTRENPWSIAFGVTQAPQNPSPTAKPTRLNLAPGLYIGGIVMTPGMIISSVETAGSKGDEEAVVQGRITGAPRAKLISITLAAPAHDAVLLTINDAAMEIIDVTFQGTGQRAATGILATGLANSDTIIDGCLFDSLATGIDIADGVPKLRRSVFQNHSGRQTLIRSSTLTNDTGAGFGNIVDPQVGFNLFRDTNTLAIVNQRTTTLSAEQNEWDTEDSTVIVSRVQGNADTSPFLLEGQSVFNGTLIVTVQDARTGTPITNAQVSIIGGGGTVGPITRNTVPGHYVFDVVGAGPYTATVDAGEAYAVRTEPLFVQTGEINSLFVAMAEPKADPPSDDSCCGGRNEKGMGKGNLMVACTTLLIMAAGARRRKE